MPEFEKPGFNVAPVRVGKYVFVGAGSKLLRAVTIGDGALFSAGAIVARGVEAFAVASGNPAEMEGYAEARQPVSEGPASVRVESKWQNG